MPRDFLFTSESVSEGHPDKICDQLSDALLDAHLREDSASRVACETFVTTGQVIVGGEITSQARINYHQIVRKTLGEIGYTFPDIGFNSKECGILVATHAQSDDIARGVSEGQGLHKEQGAGDQGLMFGYACNETPELMPATIQYAHRLLLEMAKQRKSGEGDWMRPDAKSQVTIEYRNHQPKRIHTVIISTQHTREVSQEAIKDHLLKKIIPRIFPEKLIDDKTIYHVNPTGIFVTGGPHGDCGLTGRKIIVDTYGGWGAHGGGAFSGKDPSKVDRSAAYMARYIAKNIVASGAADRCLIQLAYAIGVAEPVSIYVNTYGTGQVDEAKIEKTIADQFSCKPKDIIEYFGLLNPIYRQTAAYGHFGRSDLDLPWERTDKVETLKKNL